MSQARYYSSTAVDTALTASINDSVTTLPLGAVTGFPVSFPYTLVIDPGTESQEVVEVTSSSGVTPTVTRGVDGTAAVSHSAGAVVRHSVSARDYTEPQEHIAATSAVHGVAGSLVGTTDAQALTNKTIDGASNTISNVPKNSIVGHPSGAVVGDTDAQTLTNKTLASPAFTGTATGLAATAATLDSTSELGGVTGAVLANMPRGRVAGASNTATISIGTSESMLTGLTDIAITAVAGRRYKVTMTLVALYATPGGAINVTFRVFDGGASAPTTASTILFNADITLASPSSGAHSGPVCFHFELSGLSAGTHRIGLSALGTGTADLNANGTSGEISTITVEDIGV